MIKDKLLMMFTALVSIACIFWAMKIGAVDMVILLALNTIFSFGVAFKV